MTILKTMQQATLFTNLSEQAIRQLAADLRSRRLKRGEIIFREGDLGDVLYILAKGQVRIFVDGLDGSETSLTLFAKTGDVFGELAVIDGLPRSATAVSLQATTLYTLHRDAFRHHLQRCPELAINLSRILSMKVRYSATQMDNYSSLDVSQRLAHKLLDLSQRYGQAEASGLRITVALTQSDLASLVGATRESINKSLRDFRQQDWIQVRQGIITIRNADALRSQVALG